MLATRNGIALLSVLVGCLVLASCQAATGPLPTAPRASDTPALIAAETASPLPTRTGFPPSAPTSSVLLTPSPIPTIVPPASASPSSTCPEKTLARLSQAQRIGQLFLFGIGTDALDATETAAIRAAHFGSVWLSNRRTGGTASIRALTDAIQMLAPSDTAGVSFFVGTDQEGGLVQRLSGPGFSTIPTALAQGSLAPSVLQADARRWGSELASAGVNLDFAPVMDIVPPGTDASNAAIGALQRESGHEPAVVGTHGTAFIHGMAQADVATTLKHFPGLGRVTGNTDFTSGVVDTVTGMDDPYLASFEAGIRAGAPFVMVALATYARIDPAHLAVFSPVVITDLLRHRLGFRGVVVSDSLGDTAAVAAIPPGIRATQFIAAGGDLIVVQDVAVAEAMVTAIGHRTALGSTFRAEVDTAALRVLEAKATFGLLKCDG